MPFVKDTLREYILDKEQRKKERYKSFKSKPRLWPSDMAGCKRKIALRLQGEKETVSFPVATLEYMENGNVFEDHTGEALKYKHPNCKQNLPLRVGAWSGKADFIIESDGVIIVEHKTTGDDSFHNVPYRSHIGQLALYGYLYERKFRVTPSKLILFYRSHKHYAEFEIRIEEGEVFIQGFVDDVAEMSRLKYDVLREIKELEAVYKGALAGEPLPPKLQRKEAGCTFKGRPSCMFYYSCYPEERRE